VSELSESEATVGRHYDEAVFEYELGRLERDCPVEYAITKRHLAKYARNESTVAEVGVGGGGYTVFLAERGCRLYLADVSERLLASAIDRLSALHLSDQVVAAKQASATRLEHIPDAACGVVLLLGPLYHLRHPAERERAVHEAARVLEPDGVVLAAGINRLAYLRDTLRDSPREGAGRRAFHDGFLQDGNLDPQHAPPLGFGHLTTPGEMRELMGTAFEEITLVGVESFTNLFQMRVADLPAEDQLAWLDLVERTGPTAESLGCSDHYLYIGRKRRRSGGTP
jgi:SAM-dependent methyltransferase